MNLISNVKVHLKTRSGNVNICTNNVNVLNLYLCCIYLMLQAGYPTLTPRGRGVGVFHALTSRPFTQGNVHKLEFKTTEKFRDFSVCSKKLYCIES